MKFKLLLSLIFALVIFAEQDDFIFQNGNQKLRLELENKKRYLNWNTKTKIKIHLENIDPQKMAFSAPGLTLLRNENTSTSSTLQITPDKTLIKNDTLKLFVRGTVQEDSIFVHQFKIPIRN